MQPENETSWADIAEAIAVELRRLDPGPLAVLRRMGPGGAPALWRLSARYAEICRQPEEWRAITRILAILTPKGRAEDRTPIAHHLPLGQALCDGGDPAWRPDDPAAAKGVVSEDRLARFLATRGPARAVALERLARALTRDLPGNARIRPADIAFAVLQPADPYNRIARDYYRRLDQSHSTRDNQND